MDVEQIINFLSSLKQQRHSQPPQSDHFLCITETTWNAVNGEHFRKGDTEGPKVLSEVTGLDLLLSEHSNYINT